MVESVYHIPVLLDEVIQGLAIRPDGVYIDCTVGGGGHFFRMVEAVTAGTVLGIDRDGDAIAQVQKHCGRLATPMGKILLVQESFSQIDRVCNVHGIHAVDGILLDLGISSHQVDSPQRGFSYRFNGMLDMRMNNNQRATAATLLATTSGEGLTAILERYGEIRHAERMAQAFIRYRQDHELQSSGDVCACLEAEYGRQLPNKVLSKVFQAFRIAVNNELVELEECLKKSKNLLSVGGRLVVIAYHSLEDRIVKNFFRDHEHHKKAEGRVDGQWPLRVSHGTSERDEECGNIGDVIKLKRVTKRAIQSTPRQIAENRRCRSARLRIAERVA
ncbi:MAG: 16S rRNA (cytosine(1402)-N(4))-methyltransferase RsmH [Chitinivibrionales bacterium]|nr:16S rRNA (cytosine(1402)-N(4))-methyltransferase RsmH [Chitinivibrionales bacterium]